jgi:two-component system, response regulator YesN
MRIVIVEDELRIREGLARLIAKAKEDYRVVGEARDGLEGERVVAREKPDLVITDVRMPDLDGLEMLARIRGRGLKCRAIVLSAFSEFTYAREAIRLGVSGYLLKPVKVAELARALETVEGAIAEERRAERDAVGSTLEGALYSAIVGGSEVDESAFGSTLAGASKSAGPYALATVYLGHDYPATARRAVGLAEATLASGPGFGWRIVELPRSRRFTIFVFGVERVEVLRLWFENRFLARMRESGIDELCVGWGSFDELAKLRETALGIDETLEWSLPLGVGGLIAWPEVEATATVPLRYPASLESEVRAALCALDRERYARGISDFMAVLRGGGVHSPKDIKSAFIRFFWSALGAAREISYERCAALAQEEMLETIRFAVAWSELEAAADVLRGLSPEPEGADGRDGALVARAKNVVREAFSQGITLNEVAQRISVTPEYLSSMFHRETGCTFSAYIRDMRVIKAKELLIGSSLRLGEISDRVGYRDAKYFCRVFKEATGMKPSEFRKANR